MCDSCNSFCLPSWLCQHWALGLVLRRRICDISQCSPSCCLLALQLCVQAGVVADITKRFSGAAQHSLPAITVRVLCQRCLKIPLAFQVPLCDDSCIFILHKSFVSQHYSGLSVACRGVFQSPPCFLMGAASTMGFYQRSVMHLWCKCKICQRAFHAKYPVIRNAVRKCKACLAHPPAGHWHLGMANTAVPPKF